MEEDDVMQFIRSADENPDDAVSLVASSFVSAEFDPFALERGNEFNSEFDWSDQIKTEPSQGKMLEDMDMQYDDMFDMSPQFEDAQAQAGQHAMHGQVHANGAPNSGLHPTAESPAGMNARMNTQMPMGGMYGAPTGPGGAQGVGQAQVGPGPAGPGGHVPAGGAPTGPPAASPAAPAGARRAITQPHTAAYHKAEQLLQRVKFGAPDNHSLLPIPPHTDILDVADASHRDNLQLEVRIEDFPTQSRVETQIKCRLVLQTKAQGTAPPQVLLKLPEDTIARPRFQMLHRGRLYTDAELYAATLRLSVDVIDPDRPKQQILMCPKCMERERRRAFRKKAMDPHEELYWTGSQLRRIVIFNCRELLPVSALGEVEMPLRVACYCRHHQAKNGYQLIFGVRDSDGRLLGRAVSPRVYITDSHKDHKKREEAEKAGTEGAADGAEGAEGAEAAGAGASASGGGASSRAKTSTAETSMDEGGSSKNPTPSAGSAASTPSAAAGEEFETASVDSQDSHSVSSTSSLPRPSSSASLNRQHPYARPKQRSAAPSAHLARQIQQSQSVPSWLAGIQPEFNAWVPPNTNSNGMNSNMNQNQGMPQGMPQGMNGMTQGGANSGMNTNGMHGGGMNMSNMGGAQGMPQGMHSHSSSTNSLTSVSSHPMYAAGATIFRVIPPSGSVRGGAEVTLLGQGFRPGLVAMFGENASISTQHWSDSTIIAHLPPSSQPGPVPVTFRDDTEVARVSAPVFTYINDGEDKLKELTLQMIGYKMGGKLDDIGGFLDQMNQQNQQQNQFGAGFHQGIQGNHQQGNHQQVGLHGEQHEQQQEQQEQASHQAEYQESSQGSHPGGPNENGVSGEFMALYALEHLPRVRNAHPLNINLRNDEGQSMVHLAAMLGYASVIKALMARQAYLDLQDVSGYTPLHFAVLFDNRNVTRLLLRADADPFNRTSHGLTALDLADGTVEDLLPKDQRSWFNEMNRRGSSSSLSEMEDDGAATAAAADDAAPSSTAQRPATTERNNRPTADDARTPVARRGYDDDSSSDANGTARGTGTDASDPPTYRQLYPDPASTSNGRHGFKQGTRRRTIRRQGLFEFEFEFEDELELEPRIVARVRSSERPASAGEVLEAGSELSGSELSPATSAVSTAISAASRAGTPSTRGSRPDTGASDAVPPLPPAPVEEIPAWMEKWNARDVDIRNDKMLFTFWIPLSLVTLVGIFIVYVLQNYGNPGAPKIATYVGDTVSRLFSSAVDRMMPMPRITYPSTRR